MNIVCEKMGKNQECLFFMYIITWYKKFVSLESTMCNKQWPIWYLGLSAHRLNRKFHQSTCILLRTEIIMCCKLLSRFVFAKTWRLYLLTHWSKVTDLTSNAGPRNHCVDLILRSMMNLHIETRINWNSVFLGLLLCLNQFGIPWSQCRWTAAFGESAHFSRQITSHVGSMIWSKCVLRLQFHFWKRYFLIKLAIPASQEPFLSYVAYL